MTKSKSTKQSIKGVNIPVYFNKPDTRALERVAKTHGISKNALIKNIIKKSGILT